MRHEAFLNKLRRSRRGVCIDIDAGKQVGISPVMNTGCSATEFYPHATSYQIRNHFLKRVPRCYIPFSVVGRIMRCHVARVGWKTGTTWDLAFQSAMSLAMSWRWKREAGRSPFEQ